jgi:hypothetical protein
VPEWEVANMTRYDFAVIIAASKMSHEEILDATDALGEAGCTDASLCGHAKGMDLQFTRSARSLQGARAHTDVARLVWECLGRSIAEVRKERRGAVVDKTSCCDSRPLFYV